MTKGEFTGKLRNDGRVDFDGSIITAPTREILDPIIQTIELVLPDEETVSHAVQLGNLKGGSDDWKETLIWILSLRSHLVALTAEVKYEGVKPRRFGRLHVTHDFHRKNRVKANLRVRCAGGTSGIIDQVNLSLDCNGTTIEVKSGPSLEPKALCRFMGSLLN